jgi:hypothetical protein
MAQWNEMEWNFCVLTYIYVRVLRDKVDLSYSTSTVSTTRGPVIPVLRVQELYSTPVVGRWSDMDGGYGVLVPRMPDEVYYE